ncbi:hypothetical protein I316_01621 [Kwoniella heveanensis BCC8398]|uniref:HSF-type DNA-binding domain-containing protein n=1 Tax=Kwoniella heveanensis BCC8398 TaxID=1296120 RepID=A0A1B9GZE9_9TREE|nr:hypothetical protein I316_01621 [Kwoniella heveanensis BCC8398]
MKSSPSCLPPGPRGPGPELAAIPTASSYPPPPSALYRNRSLSNAHWDAKPPMSQSRPYVSPDPSPLDERFHQAHGYVQRPGEPLDRQNNSFPPPLSHHPREFPYPPPFLHGRSGDLPLPQHQTADKAYSTVNVGRRMTYHDASSGGDETDPYFNPVMVAPQRQQRKGKGSKKVEGKQPTFLTKLYGDQPEYNHIIRWDETGEAIIIENPEELADKILPVVYRQSRFASFSRQLNIYGFNRKLSLRHIERGICDPDASTWSHPFLKRDSTKAQILSFKRRVPPRPSQAQKRRMSMSFQDEGLSPTSSEHSVDFHSPPDAYQHHLLPDVDEEKPIFFPPPPRESIVSQPPYAAPDYYAFEQASPGAVEFDYGTPGPGRLSLTMPQCPYDPSRGGLKLEDPSLFHHNFGSKIHEGLAPQSAPANTSSFPIPIKVTQQHVRTRSVQGEPPSAMLYSPSSPYNTESWLSGEVPEPLHGGASFGVKREPSDVQHRGLDGGPTFDANDASTWARRGFADLTTGNLNALRNATLSSSPQSLPNDFGSQGYSYSNGLAVASQSFSALSPESPTTVSPGVYQLGFPFPAPPPTLARPTYASGSPPIPRQGFNKTGADAHTHSQTRQERRSTISSSPYSPRSRASALSVSGSLRTLADRRGSYAPLGGLELKLGDRRVRDAEEEEQALPSASIKLGDSHPFEGILRENAEI